jgi:DNA-binding LacI/PurR family transcriptional regulator
MSFHDKGRKAVSKGTNIATTAYDVARLAGVSQSAVSRAFSPGTSISPQTLDKVKQAAKKLGYRPNAIARMLSTSRSKLVGVVIPPLENHFYATMLEALSEAFGGHGYRLLLFTSHSQQSFEPLMAEVLSSRVDALVMIAVAISSSFTDECRQNGMPVVLLVRKTSSDAVSSVVGASKLGAETIAQFLIAGKHRRYAFIAGDSDSSTSRDREEAFTKVLRKHDLKLNIRVNGNYSFERTCELARGMLSSKLRPDAIFCVNDHTALAVLNIAKEELGLSVGKDISIVSVDDSALAKWPIFGLTTYVHPISEMVRHVVEIISRQLAGESKPMQVVVPGELVVRSSARIPKNGVVGPPERRVWMPNKKIL